MSRTQRIGRALTIGYGYQAIVALTGIVLTPFLLSRLGPTDFGFWLVVGQILGVLTLLDLGITAILPREVARATGGEQPVDTINEIAQRSQWLVLFQLPVVILVAAVTWWIAVQWEDQLRGPLAVVLTVYVLLFPLRTPAAILNGLQDLEFVSIVTASGWLVTTGMTIGLLVTNWGLFAVVIAWSVGQIFVASACYMRLTTRHSGIRLLGPRPEGRSLLKQLRPSLWMSLAQVAQLLVTGTDLLIIGAIIGPAAVVSYSCTLKILSVLSNQCYSIGLLSQPALAELHSMGEQDRLRAAMHSVGLALLALSGAISIAYIGFNSTFVSLWVGNHQHAGIVAMSFAALSVLVRHGSFVLWSSSYVMGYERRMSLILVADGVLTVFLMIAFAHSVGIIGIPLGSLAGALLVYLPSGVATLSAALKVSAWEIIAWYGPWGFRFVAVIVPTFVMTNLCGLPFWIVCIMTGFALVVYLASLYSLAVAGPLKSYRDRIDNIIANVYPRWKQQHQAPSLIMGVDIVRA